eukprot:m.243160 g.243160  ORF g.243160 m.243160 type:complete len:296 (-) comp27018_c0_seq1:26-913(-)
MAQSTHARVLFAWRFLAICLTVFVEWVFHLSVLVGILDQYWSASFPFFVQVILIICSMLLTQIFRHDISLRQFNRAKQKDHISSSYLKCVCVCIAGIVSMLLVAVFVSSMGNDGEGLSWYRSVLGACSTFYTLLFLETMIIRNNGVYTFGTVFRLISATVNLIGLDVVHTHSALFIELLYLLYLSSDAVVFYSLFLKTTSLVEHANPTWLRASYYSALTFLVLRVAVQVAVIATQWDNIERMEKIYFLVCECVFWLPCQCWNVLVYRRHHRRHQNMRHLSEVDSLVSARTLQDPM